MNCLSEQDQLSVPTEVWMNISASDVCYHLLKQAPRKHDENYIQCLGSQILRARSRDLVNALTAVDMC